MRVAASDIFSLYRPTICALRVYLREQGIPESEPGAFEEVLKTLGERHELAHLATLGRYKDISTISPDLRVQQTLEAIRDKVPVIYQGELACETALGGTPVTLVGRPDFLVLDGDGYLIRDSKLSRKVDEKHHVEIALQLQLYGWLFEQLVGTTAKSLQVHAGGGDIINVPYDGGTTALAELARILDIRNLKTEPYEPLGWTKCGGGCGYYERCWKQAEDRQDVSLVMEVDQNLARALNCVGVTSAAQLVAKFDAKTLSEFKKPWGKGFQRVGKRADKILMYADVLCSGQERLIDTPDIPRHANYVMFDLEGMPPYLDEIEKIYLWGMQVYGKEPSTFLGVTAGFGANGDREGWEAFLVTAKSIFERYGDIPFIHWHHYERVHIEQYVDRFGDRDGIAARVLANLLDLHPITKNAIALPLPSYSLKVVEQYVGFKRTQDEYGGSWSMAQFILATESEDDVERNRRMGEIVKYNEEDLAATWAVFEWLQGKTNAVVISSVAASTSESVG